MPRQKERRGIGLSQSNRLRSTPRPLCGFPLLDKAIMKIACCLENTSISQRAVAALGECGECVEKFGSDRDLIRAMRATTWDVVLLGWRSPSIPPLELLRWVLASSSTKPIVSFVTDDLRKKDVIAALNAGADDCIIVPVSHDELIARVLTLFRHASILRLSMRQETSPQERMPQETTRLGGALFFGRERTISIDERELRLKPAEYQLAWALFGNVGTPVSRAYLQSLISPWRDGSRDLDAHIRSLRAQLRVLAGDKVELISVRGIGFQLDKTGNRNGDVTNRPTHSGLVTSIFSMASDCETRRATKG